MKLGLITDIHEQTQHLRTALSLFRMFLRYGYTRLLQLNRGANKLHFILKK